jgi:tetratricopeptide (TPR) repeat protein
LDWVKQHPGNALSLFARKYGYAFVAQHIALPYSYPFYAHDAGTALRFYAIGPWLLVPLGLIGLVFAAPHGRRADYLVWAAFVPAYGAAVALFFISERYRLPLLVPLCIGSGAAVDRLATALSAKRVGGLAMPAAAFAVLFAFANWPRPLRDGRWDEGLRMAQRLVILGRYEEANEWARRLEPGSPRPGLAAYGIGMQYREVGQPALAVPHLTRARELDPNQPIVEYGLGQALLDAGRPRESIEYLRRGFQAGLDVPLAGYDLAVALERTGDHAAAADVVRRIKPTEEVDHEVWLRLGRLAARAKAPDAAEPFFRRAVEMRPDQAAARKQYGLNLLLLGRHDQAARELAEAVRLDPRDPDSLAHLAYSEYQLGRTADALRHAEAALALNPEDRVAKPLAAALRRSRRGSS